MVKNRVDYVRTAWVPVLHGCACEDALKAACRLAVDVVLVGVVYVPAQQPLSAGAYEARQVRRKLRALSSGEQVRYKSQAHVSHRPWADLVEAIAADEPDLLLLEWPCQLDALHVTAAEVLTRPPCDVALVRGPLPDQIQHVLVPVRGGPHAELALRVGLSANPIDLTALHLTSAQKRETDAPFRGLEQILKSLPEIKTRSAVTTDLAQKIIEGARDADLIVMGATAQPVRSKVSLGDVADRVLKEAQAAVIAVKTRRPMPQPHEAAVGAQAISIVVDKWFAENTYHADEFKQLDRLVALKREQGLTISLALPALNEEQTVGHVIKTLKHALLDKTPLLDEIVLIDSDSTDRTRAIAAELGVSVFVHQALLPQLGARWARARRCGRVCW